VRRAAGPIKDQFISSRSSQHRHLRKKHVYLGLKGSLTVTFRHKSRVKTAGAGNEGRKRIARLEKKKTKVGHFNNWGKQKPKKLGLQRGPSTPAGWLVPVSSRKEDGARTEKDKKRNKNEQSWVR